MVVFLTIQLMVPFNHFDASMTVYVIYTLLIPVIWLMYFVKVYMNSKYDDNDENVELCKVLYLKMALDCLAVIWVSYSYNGLMMIVHDRY